MEKDKLSEELIMFNSKYTELRIKYDKSEQERLESQRLAMQYEQRLAKLEPQLQLILRENSELHVEVQKLADELRGVIEENRYLKIENEELQRIREIQAKEIFERDSFIEQVKSKMAILENENACLLYTSDAADE